MSSCDYYALGLQIPDRVFVQGSPTREGYTGHELDPETGDYYAGARYYLPELGRWTAVDPMAAKYPSLSPYVYGGNNSLSFVDPGGDTLRYHGSASFNRAASRAVDQALEIPLFAKMVSTLIASTRTHVIDSRSFVETLFGGGYNPNVDPAMSYEAFYAGVPQGSKMTDWSTRSVTRDGVTMDPVEVVGHELTHMFAIDQGLAGNYVKVQQPQTRADRRQNEELRAVAAQNVIRLHQGDSTMRTKYGKWQFTSEELDAALRSLTQLVNESRNQ